MICYCYFQTGLLRTNSGDYLIEPVKGHKISKEGHQPHLVYKRSALPNDLHLTVDDEHKDTGTCGVKGRNANNSFFFILLSSSLE